MFALFLSLLTTGYGVLRERNQIVQVDRGEMRTLIQRLNEITRENVLIQNQYTGSIATSLTGALQAESNALISQAVEIAGRIPEYMTSSEYSTLANHLFTKGDNERAGDFYRLAIESAKSPFEEVGALRGYAGFLMSIGNPDEGRKFYQKALDVFNDPSRQVTDISRPYMNAYTEYYWASMELGPLGL